MAGAFSGHLIDSFSLAQTPRGPFGQALNIATHGSMAFAPQMHGTFSTPSSSMFSDQSFAGVSQESAIKIAELQAKLDKKLGPEYISQRPGPGGGPKLTYAEGWKIINLANEVFGFNGWSSNIVNLTTDFIDVNEETKRVSVGVTAVIRVTLRDGVFHEDVGYGLLENSKSKGAALDKCKKEAVTDAVKRTLRNFGNVLGNCLYDKAYTQEVVKIKVPPPKFDRSELHRRPEFEETKPNVNSIASTSTGTGSLPSEMYTMNTPSNPVVKTEAGSSMLPPPATFSRSASVPATVSTLSAKGKAPAHAGAEAGPSTSHDLGLQTPAQTPSRPATGRLAQNVQDRHAARLKQIQDAQQEQDRHAARLKQIQDAQREAEEASAVAEQERQRRVSFAVPDPAPSSSTAPASTSTPPTRSRAVPAALLEPDDEFHFNSDDDAFLAAVDLGELDEGIGRPIDYEEDSAEAGPAPAHDSAPPPPARPQTAYGSHARPPAGGADPQNEGGRATTPSMGGGFKFPTGAPGAARAQASTVPAGLGVKRTADAMQGYSTAARRPAQGMGLQHAGGGVPMPQRREPLGSLEIGDGGDVKRARR